MQRFLLYISIHVYSLLLELLRLLLPLFDSKGTKFSKLLIRERLNLPNVRKRTSKTIWVHASSLGESKVLYKFLKILDQKYPDVSFVLTAVTKTGVDFLNCHKTDSVSAVGFLPLDTIRLMSRMVKHFNITRLWLVETEIWPAMLWVCLIKTIPVGIVNARMEKKSFKFYHYFLMVLKPVFEQMDCILAQDKMYAARFEAMGVSPGNIHVTGNIKSRVIIRPPAPNQKDLFRRKLNLTEKSTVITAGCVHPGEAKIIRNAADVLSSRGYQWKWIIIPRHLNKVPVILEELGKETLHTKTIDFSDEWNMCLIEKLGILEDMYLIADAVVLGGTFVNVGGHNIWEAMQFAVPIFFGPDYHAQRESCERVLSAGVGFCVNNENELAEGLLRVLATHPADISSNMSVFMEAMKKNEQPLESFIP